MNPIKKRVGSVAPEEYSLRLTFIYSFVYDEMAKPIIKFELPK